MKSFLCLLILLVAGARAVAQIDTEMIPPEQDQNDLFARAAASRLVVIGTVVKSEGVPKNIPLEAVKENLQNGTALGGSLVTFQPDETVCRQSDFDQNMPTVEESTQPLYLFIPFDESSLPPGRFREVLLPGNHYLLLLELLDSRSLSAAYKLDAGRTYYRGQEQNRGVVPLDSAPQTGKQPSQPEVVDKFRKLCAAMRPARPEDKLTSLQGLADSGDLILMREAETAKQAVKTSMHEVHP